jgi:hypothetical protein
VLVTGCVQDDSAVLGGESRHALVRDDSTTTGESDLEIVGAAVRRPHLEDDTVRFRLVPEALGDHVPDTRRTAVDDFARGTEMHSAWTSLREHRGIVPDET